MNSISESFRNNPLLLNHIIPLDFNNVLKLPDSHAWTLFPDPLNDDDDSIPLIDLAQPHALSLIRQACEIWGMFQVTNHGIPITLLHQIERQTQRLFALPANQKLLALRSPDGFTGYGLARISNFFSKQMWYEGFTVMGYPEQHASQLWPNDHTIFCDVIEEYQREMKELAEKLIGLLLESLGLTPEDVNWFRNIHHHHHHHQDVLQLNSYPVCPDPGRAMGLPPHTDSSLLTVLHQSNATGLQVLRDGIGWVPVHPVDGALVVNVGDLMHIITNGRFKSALHRALVNNTRHRMSIAYFYGPPRDVKISPLMKLIDFDHPNMYRPVTWKEYLDVKATHFDKALEFIKYDAFMAKQF
ncbi:gibberellin 3-beta-dioxygenase 3-like [Hevea brasiliensis]|uniref:gibberellin 3-beta-dioxygenase 3-like n=1 Tax=Hevea brasiliensis TaxID=3981 RepID=UPI0025D3FBA6|nr:gibberellin 3-beta-dioxygenase 3-like [Hevea brasiliensis]